MFPGNTGGRLAVPERTGGRVGGWVGRGRARGRPCTPPVMALRTWRLMMVLSLGGGKSGLMSRRPIAGYLASREIA